MKTFDYYLDEVAKESGFTGFAPAFMNSSEILKITREANKRFTTAAIKEYLSRAADNAKTYEDWYGHVNYGTKVDRESITNIDIELP